MSEKIRVGVNGFGRIGRCFTRLCLQLDDIEVVAINDLAPIETLTHLLRYDSVHGRLAGEFKVSKNELILPSNDKIVFTQFNQPSAIPWKELGVDIVIESTGKFLTRTLASGHLEAGAKQVILSAPAIGEDIPTIVLGVNDHLINRSETIYSNASCTTNSAAPLIAVMQEMCQIE
ncbi:MAG: type I glyceraldehyde-3-phosphate dehydrogenase, partial [Fluviicola sp.]|nr:type I glyceraldehyde-3-phosphate dehydrogenase [Fluviicola sp.]